MIDVNCDTAILLNDYKCEFCLQGYFRDFENNKCFPCFDMNCGYCNPNDYKDCFICKDSYFQNFKGECVNDEKVVFEDFLDFEFVWILNLVLFLILL